MDYNEGCKALDAIQAGKVADTEAALNDAIHVYRSMGTHVKELGTLQAQAKTIIAEIMHETGQVKAVMPAGTAQFTAASERVSWDSDALDALCASDANLARILLPHRTVKPVAGSLTIK